MKIFVYTFLIPAYNEENRIGSTLKQLKSAFPDYGYTVVFDGNDNTPDVVSKFSNVRLARFGKRLGKGGAIIWGLKKMSDKDLIILIDADMPVMVRDIRIALKYAENADMLVTNRVYFNVPRFRFYLHHLFNALAKLFFPELRPFADWQGGFKIIRAEKAKEVMKELIMNDFLIDTNLVCAFLRRKYKVIDLALQWTHTEEDSKISGKLFKAILLEFLSLVKLRAYYSPFNDLLFSKSFLEVQAKIQEFLR
ncbi:MAG: glycosyltransferase family 2 protein [Candidatus Parvarchaeota archaeon]